MTSRQDYKIALQTLQSWRLRRDYADLAAEPQYRQLGEFFFQDLYGPADFSARDQQARRLHHFVHMAPGLSVRDIEPVLTLLELTNRLDDSVVDSLIALQAPLDFDEPLYERAYRAADNYVDRVRQLDLVRVVLYNVHRLTSKPLLGVALRRSESLAAAAGMADLHRFLRRGYEALQPVRDIHRFVETIYVRERRRLERIYANGPDGFQKR